MLMATKSTAEALRTAESEKSTAVSVSYVVETSSDLVRWAAQEERWIEDVEGGNSYYDNDARYLSKRWYRLRDRAADEDWIQPPVSIQGTVWTDATHTAPVAGAVVGTDLDGRTTTTDATGRFFLETDTLGEYGSEPYTIKVTAGGTTETFGPSPWVDRPRDQHFEMQ